jgi:hypothetical protein
MLEILSVVVSFGGLHACGLSASTLEVPVDETLRRCKWFQPLESRQRDHYV